MFVTTSAQSSGAVASVEVRTFTEASVMLWCRVVTGPTSMMTAVGTARRPRRPGRPAAVHCVTDTPNTSPSPRRSLCQET